MGISVELKLEKSIDVREKWDVVYDILEDMESTTKYFPDLERLDKLGNNRFRWNMKPVGVEKFSIQVAYECLYEFSKERKNIRWTPIPNSGNAEIWGEWNIESLGEGSTRLRFETHGQLNLPVPRIFRRLAEPIVRREFTKSIENFLVEFQKSFDQ